MALVRRGGCLETSVMWEELTNTLGYHRLLFLSVMTFTSSRKPSFTPQGLGWASPGGLPCLACVTLSCRHFSPCPCPATLWARRGQGASPPLGRVCAAAPSLFLEPLTPSRPQGLSLEEQSLFLTSLGLTSAPPFTGLRARASLSPSVACGFLTGGRLCQAAS